jgi:hypothetical protein
MDIEYQDARLILKNLELWNIELIRQNNTVKELGGALDI